MPPYSKQVMRVGAENKGQPQGTRKECAGGVTVGSSPGPSPGPSPGQPVRQEEVLLDVIHQGAPHFLHHLEDALEVVKLQGS